MACIACMQEPMRAEEVRVNRIEAVEDTGDFLCVMTGNMCPHSQRIQVCAGWGGGGEEWKGALTAVAVWHCIGSCADLLNVTALMLVAGRYLYPASPHPSLPRSYTSSSSSTGSPRARSSPVRTTACWLSTPSRPPSAAPTQTSRGIST